MNRLAPVVAGVCIYEALAIASHGRWITVSEFCRRHPLVAWGLITLAVHHFVVESPYDRRRFVNAHRR